MIDDLVRRLNSLADCDARTGEPLGKCMREAATVIAQLARDKESQIAYSVDLQRIIEDLCAGRAIREPETPARHHYKMAAAAVTKRRA